MTGETRGTMGELMPVSDLVMPEPGRGRWEVKSAEVVAVKKPSREFCKVQILRLRGLPWAPRGDDATAVIGALTTALALACWTEAHARATIDEILEMPIDRFPAGYDISQTAYRLRPIEKRPDPNCETCYGTGHALREVRGIQCADPEPCACVAPREVVRG